MKTLCIYHRVDLDGWMSAAIVKRDFISKNPELHVIINLDNPERNKVDVSVGITRDMNQNKVYNTLYMKGFQYGDPLPVLEGYDQIILVDISLPIETMVELYRKLNKDLIYIDHHAAKIIEVRESIGFSKINGLQNTESKAELKAAGCELAWIFYNPGKPMNSIVEHLGAYDCFRHQSYSEKASLEVLQFQYGARASMSSYNDCFDMINTSEGTQEISFDIILDNGFAIYKYLKTEAEGLYKEHSEIILSEPVGDEFVKRNFAVLNRMRFNPVNYGIEYHKDGYDGFLCYWRQGGKWHFSIYNDDTRVDCAAIAKTFRGGGHRGASGFVLTDNEFKKLGL